LLFIVINWANSATVTYTPDELKALEKFRPIAIPIVKHDWQTIDSYLIRWLRAQNLDVRAAFEMLQKAQKWREEVKIDDELVNKTVPGFRTSIYSYDGVDKEGRTIFTLSPGDIDLRRIVLGGNQDWYLQVSWHAKDRAIAAAAKSVLRSNGTHTDSRLFEITDLNGFSLRKHACLACIGALVDRVRQATNYFPGATYLDIYINTPRVAQPLVGTLLRAASEDSRNTVKVFGTDRAEWSEYLLNLIDADQLTYQFGGTKKH
jgi:hypothetical protein